MPVEDITPQMVSQHIEVPEMSTPLQGFDVIAHLREATDSPSPLTLFLQDPAVLELSRAKHKNNRRRQSRSPHRGHSPSIMALALVEEERQANRLKSILRSASDRLEFEIRRGNDAVDRAEYTEVRIKEISAKAEAAEAARRQTEIAAEQSSTEISRYQIRLEGMTRKLERLQADVLRLEKQKDILEESIEQAKGSSRHYQQALRQHQAHEEGREEGRRSAMKQCFENGRQEGWNAGQCEGYEEGRKDGYEEGLFSGRKEGLREGKEQGRIEERRNALEAFDRFLTEEMDEHDDVRSERIRRWAESIYQSNSVTGSPRKSSPASFRRR